MYGRTKMTLAEIYEALDAMLIKYRKVGILRNRTENAPLEMMCWAMRDYQGTLGIADRYLTIAEYLARNEAAVIIPDENVLKTFELGKAALAIAERHDREDY